MGAATAANAETAMIAGPHAAASSRIMSAPRCQTLTWVRKCGSRLSRAPPNRRILVVHAPHQPPALLETSMDWLLLIFAGAAAASWPVMLTPIRFVFSVGTARFSALSASGVVPGPAM